MPPITDADIVAMLKAEVARVGKGCLVAIEIGVSHAMLSYVVHGRKPPGEKIAAYFGIERVSAWVPKGAK